MKKIKAFPYLKKTLTRISFFVLVAFLTFVTGCSYYKVKNAAANSATISQEQKNNKYFILHQGNSAWHLKAITLNEDKNEMYGTLEELPEYHQNYRAPDSGIFHRYRPYREFPVTEVHIYISQYTEGKNSQIIISMASVHKIEIYDRAVGATIASHLFTAAGITAGALGAFYAIILLTKSSCPFVYINEGSSFHFSGEMYGGAIYSSLERDDYMPLPGLIAANGEYQLKISNELLEKQYTNLAGLVIAEHPENAEVLLDKNGNIQTITKAEAPVSAFSGSSNEYTKSFLFKDNDAYLFNDSNSTNKDINNVQLTFKKPLNSKTGKLIINARNSFWLDYAYGKFTGEFGTYYQTFAEDQKKVPAAKNIQWSLDQNIPLSVFLETENGWEFVDYFNVTGPLAPRDLVMSVDLSKIKGQDVRIKLESGFMFWEIDYAAMDFSENIPVKITYPSPWSALDENGKDISALISSNDTRYLIQPAVGDEITLKYKAGVSRENYRQTFFLRSRGYYEYIRDYKNKPNFSYLNNFKKKGSFTRYAKQRYNEFITDKNIFTTVLTDSHGN